jgi:signal peptidase I
LAFSIPGVFLFFGVRIFLFQPFNIPSGSGFPNLVEGDHFFVSKTAYGYSRYSFPLGLSNFEGRILAAHPQRGDLAIFRLPSDPKVDFVMRVIGLPGDTVQMRNGFVYVNGTAMKQELVNLDPDYYADETAIRFYRETTPDGRSYVIANLTDGSNGDTTDVYAVPAGHYFTLGDNRDNSMDSRYSRVGFVPEENFIGPVVWRYFNIKGFPLYNRPVETSGSQ